PCNGVSLLCNLLQLGEVRQSVLLPASLRARGCKPVRRISFATGFTSQLQQLIKVPFPDEFFVAVRLCVSPVIRASNQRLTLRWELYRSVVGKIISNSIFYRNAARL